MAAIAAIADWSGRRPDRFRIDDMLGVFAGHGEGPRVLESGAASLGIARLDTVTGRTVDPSGFTDGEMLAVVDGRFDEPDEARRRLELPFEVSDTTLVLRAYERWGTAFARHLTGEFAAVIWDARQRQLIVARDPFGIRPVYYCGGNDRLLVASDPEQLLASRLVSSEPNDTVVVDYLRWEAAGLEATFYRDIRRLPGGHVLVATQDNRSVFDYRHLGLSRTPFSDREECFAEYRRLFTQSVRRRLSSSHPVVTQLSGGLDSTAIACVADAVTASSPEPCPSLKGAAALHPGLPCDEEVFIRAAAETLRFPVETWDGTLADEHELHGVPLSMPGGQYFLTGGTRGDFEIARRGGARVILTGSGGDQHGIPDGALEDAILGMRWRDALRFVTARPRATPFTKLKMIARTAKALAPPWVRAMHHAQISQERDPAWMSPWARAYPRILSQAAPPAELTTHLQRRRWAALTSPRHAWSTEHMQQHAIRHGIEIRFPFMDWNLTRFVLNIPPRFWPPPWPNERLHREALGDILPPRIRERRTKAAFMPALVNRVRRQREHIGDIFESKNWAAERFVEQRVARENLAVFDRSPSPTFATVWAVWGIATLQAWLLAASRYNSRR